MNPIVDGEPAGWNPGESYFNIVSKENERIVIPQAKVGSYRLSCGDTNGVTQRCTSSSEPVPCRHLFHIPTSQRNEATLPTDVGNIAAVLNYQVHISQGALQYCDLIYHTLIGSFKGQPSNSPDLITKLEDLQKQVQQLSSKVGDIRLSQKDIDQISSKTGIVVSGNVQVPTAEEIASKIKVPTAEEIASKIKVPTAREITYEIGELSLNEYTKCDLVNRISKLIPASGLEKDNADKISIPPFMVTTAAEIASHIRIPSAADLASQMKIPTAQEIANQIHIPESKIDYERIASEVVNRIHLPETQSIDISSLAQQIADRIPKCDPAATAANFRIPPQASFSSSTPSFASFSSPTPSFVSSTTSFASFSSSTPAFASTTPAFASSFMSFKQ